jgi:hypothetical protein
MYGTWCKGTCVQADGTSALSVHVMYSTWCKESMSFKWMSRAWLSIDVKLYDTAEYLRKPFSSGNAVNLFQVFGWKLKGVWLRVGIHTLERCYVASSTFRYGFNEYTWSWSWVYLTTCKYLYLPQRAEWQMTRMANTAIWKGHAVAYCNRRNGSCVANLRIISNEAVRFWSVQEMNTIWWSVRVSLVDFL